MASEAARPRDVFANPLPGIVLGDPFVLRYRGRFYMYGTNDGDPLPDGRVVPAAGERAALGGEGQGHDRMYFRSAPLGASSR